ncbi:hypothetical protein PcP3B5_04020 [Pseudomonas citronellolis]|nr:hypothetical protein PcP3B5_04020 [Pseudomonas citronellolis]
MKNSDSYPIEQVLAETPLSHFLHQISVGSRNQPYIDL